MNDKHLVYVGLGSNQADPQAQVEQARAALGNIEGIYEVAFSSLYQSEPMASQVDQPDYINAVMAVKTALKARALLALLQSIEAAQGRVRVGEHWGPRTLDLDLLLYGQAIINTIDLVVPHYGIAERAFVLFPLQEIAPDLFIPGNGLLADLIQQCPRGRLHRLPA